MRERCILGGVLILRRPNPLIRKLVNWMLVAVISLSPPGASLVRNHCDVSGTTSVSVTLMSAFVPDPCCGGEGRDALAMAPIPRDCCSSSVFSLAQTGPAPGQPDADAPVPGSFRIVAPELPSFVSMPTASPVRSSLASRTLPLLI